MRALPFLLLIACHAAHDNFDTQVTIPELAAEQDEAPADAEAEAPAAEEVADASAKRSAKAEPATPRAPMASMRESATVGRGGAGASSRRGMKAKLAPAPAPRLNADMAPPPPPQHFPPRQSLDFGGETYLSNDDSMSLASAQRVIWAVEHGQKPALNHIRAHELLNYFNFDTRPARGENFSAVGSMMQTGSDEFAMSLALRSADFPRRPMDVTVLIDKSGSMNDSDGRMALAESAMRKLAQQLGPQDRLDIIAFDSSVRVLGEDIVMSPSGQATAARLIRQIQPGGSTDLNSGLRTAYELAQRGDTSRERRVVLLTDARMNTGAINADVVTEIGRAMDQDGIRLTGVGVGHDFYDHVLDKLTEKGKGAYVFLGSEAVVDRYFGSGLTSLLTISHENVRFKLDLPPSLGLETFYGEESSKVASEVQEVHFHANTSQLFLQELRAAPGGINPYEELRLEATWEDPASGAQRSQTLRFRVSDLLSADDRNTRKALALMGWAEMLKQDAMGGDGCRGARRDFERWSTNADVELRYVAEKVDSRCGPTNPVAFVPERSTVPWKVRLDSDQPIGSVAMACSDGTQRKTMSAGENTASFSVPSGPCDLILEGAVASRHHVVVPSVGGTLKCVLRGGRVACQ